MSMSKVPEAALWKVLPSQARSRAIQTLVEINPGDGKGNGFSLMYMAVSTKPWLGISVTRYPLKSDEDYAKLNASIDLLAEAKLFNAQRARRQLDMALFGGVSQEFGL